MPWDSAHSRRFTISQSNTRHRQLLQPSGALAWLVRDPDWRVREAAWRWWAGAPGIGWAGAQDPEPGVRRAVAQHPGCPSGVLAALARDPDWGGRALAQW